MELLPDPASALTSSTVMACAPWAAQAGRFAAANPQLGIGVHLTLTSEWDTMRWAPVAQGDTASLRDEEGYMWHTTADVEAHAVLSQADAEIQAVCSHQTSSSFSGATPSSVSRRRYPFSFVT